MLECLLYVLFMFLSSFLVLCSSFCTHLLAKLVDLTNLCFVGMYTYTVVYIFNAFGIILTEAKTCILEKNVYIFYFSNRILQQIYQLFYI